MDKYQGSGTHIGSLSKDELKTWLSSIDCCLTDCDGVLWCYDKIIDGSPEMIDKFKSLGKRVFFITNNSTKTREEFLVKAKQMKFNVEKENILSTAYLVAQYLKQINFQKKVYLIGSNGIAQELDSAGIKHTETGPDVLQGNMYDFVKNRFVKDPEIGAVVVGFDEHISFPKMFKAATYLDDPNTLFVATNTDERFPMPGIVIPGTGSIVRAVETASERSAFCVGKPNPYICDYITKEYGVNPEKTLMIGDRCNTDILLGKLCGFQTLLVESGIHKRSDLEEWAKSGDKEKQKLIPDFYIESLGELASLIKNL